MEQKPTDRQKDRKPGCQGEQEKALSLEPDAEMAVEPSNAASRKYSASSWRMQNIAQSIDSSDEEFFDARGNEEERDRAVFTNGDWGPRAYWPCWRHNCHT
ncbi:hypothetical protein AAFF_G00175520 [Aldrovandia affinis]|uniref:Uncharacterized protein n=1 Tax=Aldrovandia affinis TaxID=143900 RepID=A0AAD7W735_9TELE|nr:hypothetical protein AAFF_G00175520 [Aldrovandia affinis]